MTISGPLDVRNGSSSKFRVCGWYWEVCTTKISPFHGISVKLYILHISGRLRKPPTFDKLFGPEHSERCLRNRAASALVESDVQCHRICRICISASPVLSLSSRSTSKAEDIMLTLPVSCSTFLNLSAAGATLGRCKISTA